MQGKQEYMLGCMPRTCPATGSPVLRSIASIGTASSVRVVQPEAWLGLG